MASAAELVLEGLHLTKRLNKDARPGSQGRVPGTFVTGAP